MWRMLSPAHTLTCTCVCTRMYTHTHRTLGDGTMHPFLCHCPCPGSASPGQCNCPSTTACGQHHLQQGLCLGSWPNALQPLRSHHPCQQSVFQALAQTLPWAPAQHQDSIPHPRWRLCQLQERLPGTSSMGLACLHGAGGLEAALPEAIWAGRQDQSVGQRRWELPASSAAVCAAAQGRAPAGQKRDQPRMSWLPGSACNYTVSQGSRGMG